MVTSIVKFMRKMNLIIAYVLNQVLNVLNRSHSLIITVCTCYLILLLIPIFILFQCPLTK